MKKTSVPVDLITMVLIHHIPSVITLLSVTFIQIQFSILLLKAMAMAMAMATAMATAMAMAGEKRRERISL